MTDDEKRAAIKAQWREVIEAQAELLLRYPVHVHNGRQYIDANDARWCALRIRDAVRGA